MKSVQLKKIVLSTLFFTAASFAFAAQVFAGGGGRAVISTLSGGVAGEKSAEVVAEITKDNDMKLSIGEQGIFRVKNARDGQNCFTKNQKTDDSGKIYGSCSSPVSGEMEVYIYFPDKAEDGYPYKVSFAEKGQRAATVTAPSRQSGPCNSGLTSYGWDPADGKSCEPFYSDAWTAYCGNGYHESVKINSCMHANELSNHPEWKAQAEAICSNPRCGSTTTAPAAPAATVETVVPQIIVKRSPKPSPKPTPVVSPRVETVSVTVSTNGRGASDAATATMSASETPAVSPSPEAKPFNYAAKGNAFSSLQTLFTDIRLSFVHFGQSLFKKN